MFFNLQCYINLSGSVPLYNDHFLKNLLVMYRRIDQNRTRFNGKGRAHVDVLMNCDVRTCH